MKPRPQPSRTQSDKGLAPYLRRLQRSLFRMLSKVAGVRPRSIESDFSMAVPFAYATGDLGEQSRRVAAICHIFYVDLAAEMLASLRHLPPGSDVYISTTDEEKAAELKEIFASWAHGEVTVRVAPNRGRDIAPKFITFADVYEKGYEFVVFLHSKKTKDESIGPRWRLSLIETLIGSRETVASVLSAFDAEPTLGMVLPQHFDAVREHSTWQNNFLHGRALAKRMGFKLKSRYDLDFAAGSMFWTRPEALRPLLGLRLQLSEFPEENGQIGDTIAHGIERLMLFLCEFAGYRWVKIADPRYFGHQETILAIRSEADLLRFLHERDFRLLPAGVRSSNSR